jgi:hypothetical protein
MQNKRTLCLLGMALVATAAIAASPKFLRAPSASLGSPKVIVKWTEVGLGITDSVSVGGTFAVDKNGRISEALVIPAPPSTLVCPGGQVVGVASVVFTNITLTDLTNGISSPTNPSSLTYNTTECP